MFRVGGVRVADGFIDRLLGSTFRREPVLIRGSGVHSLWMRRRLWAVGLDGSMKVVAVKVLAPFRVIWLPGARWVLELPDTHTPPPVGALVDLG